MPEISTFYGIRITMYYSDLSGHFDPTNCIDLDPFMIIEIFLFCSCWVQSTYFGYFVKFY